MSTEHSEPSETRRRLDGLVGQWNIELVFPGDPPLRAQTEGSFEWVQEGFFLAYRAGTEGSGYPVGYSIIGADDAQNTYTMLYSDSRGVARLYQMSLGDGVWKLWRDDPEFAQRFTATFGEDGRTITGAWGKRMGGKRWEHDFDLIYRKV
jgi:hypothetical protein